MAIDLSALSPITTAAQSLSNLVLVTPQAVVGYAPQLPMKDGKPATGKRPAPLIFHYEGEQTITLESDITDHYVEDNSAVQDNISLKPEIITTQGFIGELNDVPPKGLDILKTAADRLTVIGAYAPQISVTASLAYSEAFFLYQSAQNVAKSAVAAWSTIGNKVTGATGQSVINSNGITVGTAQNAQQTAFQQFYGYWKKRTLFTVQTPWAVFENMAILRVQAQQEADDAMITGFSVSFKMIRSAQTITKGGVGLSLDGRAATQASGVVDLGTSSPVPSIGLSEGLSGMGL